jgi:hypothetical protein
MSPLELSEIIIKEHDIFRIWNQAVKKLLESDYKKDPINITY